MANYLANRLTITCESVPHKYSLHSFQLKVYINSDHAPRSIKELIGHRNSYYDLAKRQQHFKAAKGQHNSLGFKIMEIHSTKTLELNT